MGDARAVATVPSRPSAWHVTSRLAALRGEERANGLRVLGVAVFYAIEVLNYRGLAVGPLQIPRVEGVDASFHAMATALAVAWISVAAMVGLATKNRIFPPILKYLSCGADLFLVGSVLTLADGPRSPVICLLFLVIALAGLRLEGRLVAFTTAGAALAYVVSNLEVALRRPELAVPTHWQVTTTAALVLLGLIVWQILEQTRRSVEAYAALERAGEEGS